MTYSQRILIDNLNRRLTKEESINLSFEIALYHDFAAVILHKLQESEPKVAFNILWSLRNLTDFELDALPNLVELILDLFRKFPTNQSILRDGVGLLQNTIIPPEVEGEVFDVCFGFLQDNSQTIAVKAFSMTVCFNLAKKHSELLKELELQIKDILLLQGDSSPAIYSRGNAILKKINQRLRK
jgi:hypothetical protein